MAAKQITAEERDRIEGLFVPIRAAEIEYDPVRGTFNAAHLKEINRRLFQDLPEHGLTDVTPGQYRPAVPSTKDWIKHRSLQSVGVVSHVAYSNMDAAAIKHLDNTLASVDIAGLRKMKTQEFTAAFAKLYTELDYIHPFPDGNSRTLRAFTRQLAETCGYNVDWARFNRNPTGRDVLYIARDLSVNELALSRVKNDDTRRDITFTLDQLAGNRALPDLMRDAVLPGRAIAFRALPEAEARLAFPELKPAYETLHHAGAYALTKYPNSTEQQREMVESVRAAIQQKLDDGETKDFGPSRADRQNKREQPPTKERER